MQRVSIPPDACCGPHLVAEGFTAPAFNWLLRMLRFMAILLGWCWGDKNFSRWFKSAAKRIGVVAWVVAEPGSQASTRRRGQLLLQSLPPEAGACAAPSMAAASVHTAEGGPAPSATKGPSSTQGSSSSAAPHTPRKPSLTRKLLALPSFALAIFVFYWSLPLCALCGLLHVWDFRRPRADMYNW